MSKTLFLKSNLLHIRLKEGEYEVSNPETIFHRSYTMPSIKSREVAYTVVDGLEWPYGVELIEMLQISIGNDWKNLPYQNDYKGNMESTRTIKLARLLPAEENTGAHSFTESAYKEGEKEQFEKLASDIYDKWALNHEGRIYMTRDLFTLALYHYKQSEPVSAPSESQEEPVLFADWLIKNGWEPQMTEGCWIQYAEEPIMKKTTELYQQFKSTRNP